MVSLFETDENQVEAIEGMTAEYPYCMHERDLTDQIIPWHWHEELEIGYIQEGTSRIETVGKEYTIHQGDGFFINSNVMNRKQNANPGHFALEVNHIFHPVYLTGHFRSRFETKYLNPITQNRQIEVHVIRRGHDTSNRILKNLYELRELQAKPNNEFATRNLLSDTWMLLTEDIHTHYQEVKYVSSQRQDRLRSMISYIHRNFAQKLTAAQIADAAGISEREAARCFRGNIGQSPMEYLILYRLNCAKKLLTETDLSITEISYQCGFSDSAYFGKAFRRAFGTTPGAYRAAHDGKRSLHSLS